MQASVDPPFKVHTFKPQMQSQDHVHINGGETPKKPKWLMFTAWISLMTHM